MDYAVKDARHFLDHGEEGVALENLLGNLCEVPYPVSDELLAELRWLASKILIGPGYADLLNNLQL